MSFFFGGTSMASCSPSHQADDSSRDLSPQFWQGRYEEGTTGWDRGGPSPALDAWIRSGALPPCRILVPGCGRGHEVIPLSRLGFRVTGLDFAPAAVQAARAHLQAERLEAEVIEGDIFAFDPAELFAAIYEQTCLCALPPQRWEEYERRLASWLVPGGRLAAAFMQTDSPSGPPFACPPDAMRKLFAAERWEWPAELVPVPHPLGLVELTGILRRRPTDPQPMGSTGFEPVTSTV
jgi:methyl halide transferase